MDTPLQEIQDDITSDIIAKGSPSENPALILSADVGSILSRLVTYTDLLNSKVVPTPQGVEWITPPGTPTFGAETISETTSQISVNGNPRTVAAATLSMPYEDTGFHRIDLVVVNYDPVAPTAAYGIVQGASAPDTGTVTAPAIPANSLLVRYILIKGSLGSLIPVTLVTSASINGGPTIGADPSGKLPLVIDQTNVPDIADLFTAFTTLESIMTAEAAVVALTDGATITWDMLSGHTATVTLAGNRTLAITNTARYGTIKITQDGTGSRTLALPAGDKVINNGAGAITLSTTAGAEDILSFAYFGSVRYWNYGLRYS